MHDVPAGASQNWLNPALELTPNASLYGRLRDAASAACALGNHVAWSVLVAYGMHLVINMAQTQGNASLY